MRHKTDDLQRLLTDADRQWQPIRREAQVRPISVSRMERLRRRRLARRGLTTAGIVLCFATAAWFHSESRRSPTPGAATESTKVAAFERAVARLQQDAAVAARAGKAWQHERKRASLEAEYRNLRREALLANLQSPMERAACSNLSLARELERQLGSAQQTVAEYRRIVEQFPGTTCAIVAKHRLAQAN